MKIHFSGPAVAAAALMLLATRIWHGKSDTKQFFISRRLYSSGETHCCKCDKRRERERDKEIDRKNNLAHIAVYIYIIHAIWFVRLRHHKNFCHFFCSSFFSFSLSGNCCCCSYSTATVLFFCVCASEVGSSRFIIIIITR